MEEEWTPLKDAQWYSSNLLHKREKVPQGKIGPGYGLEKNDLVALVNELIDYLNDQGVKGEIESLPQASNKLNDYKTEYFPKWLAQTSCERLRSTQVPEAFRELRVYFWEQALSRLRGHHKSGSTRRLRKDESAEPSDASSRRNARSPSTDSVGMGQLGHMTVQDHAVPLLQATIGVYLGPASEAHVNLPMTSILDPQYQSLKIDPTAVATVAHFSYDALLAKLKTKCRKNFSDSTRIHDRIHGIVVEDQDDLEAALSKSMFAKKQAEFQIALYEPAPVPVKVEKEGGSKENIKGVQFKGESPARKSRKTKVGDVKGGSTSATSNPKPAKVPAVSQTSKMKKVAANTDPLLSPKSKPGAPDVAPNPPTVVPTPPTVVPDPPTVVPDSGNTKVLDPLAGTVPPNAINENDFEVKGATIEKDKEAALEDEMPNEDTETPEEIKKRKKQELDDEKYRLRTMFGSKTEEKLRSMTKGIIECMDREEWYAAADFWGISHENVEAIAYVILPQFWGLRKMMHRGILPYQLVEAYQMYLRELSDKNGFLFCNTMGMGKTLSVLLFILIGHVHLILFLEVQEDTKNGISSRHNIPGHPLRMPDASCPSTKATSRPFRCVCDPLSQLYGHEPRIAPTLVSGWGKSTLAWASEFEKVFGNSKWILGREKVPLRMCWQETRPTNQHCSAITPKEILECQTSLDYDALEEAENSNKQSLKRTYQLGGQHYDEYPEWKRVSLAQNFPGATRDRPAPSSGRFILVANHRSFRNVITALSHRTIKYSRTITVKSVKSQATVTRTMTECDRWGRSIYDEFHNAKGVSTLFVTNYYDRVRAHNGGIQHKAAVLSGTPCETGLAEAMIFINKALAGFINPRTHMSNWVKRIDSKNQLIMKNDVYSHVEGEDGLAKAKMWKKFADDSAKDAQVMADDKYKDAVQIGGQILNMFMIRRTPQTLNPWGMKINAIAGEFRVAYYGCRSQSSWQNTIDAARLLIFSTLRKEWEDRNGCSIHTAHQPKRKRRTGEDDDDNRVPELNRVFDQHEIRAYCTLPGLATFRANMVAQFGSAKWGNFNVSQIDKVIMNPLADSLIKKGLQTIVAGSTKLDELVKFCNKVQSGLRTDPDTVDSHYKELVPAKVLIGSSKPITLLVAYMLLVDNFGEECIAYLPGGLPHAISDARIENWRRNDGPFALLASLIAFAESITLTEASTVIILEPQDLTHKQNQFLYRVYRLGQTEAICEGYILYNPDASPELRCLRKQTFKQTARRGLGGVQQDEGIQDAVTVSGEDVKWEDGGEVDYILDDM